MNEARRQFEHMLELGIVRPSSSLWSSLLHMLPKSTPGDWHLCSDYRSLNHVTQPDYYPVPHTHDFVATLHRAMVSSKVYLVKAYHQIPVKEADIAKKCHHYAIWVI